MTLAQFIQKYVKTSVDYDGAYGAQCVDLFRQYCKDVLEIPERTEAVDGAKDIYLKFHDLPKQEQYFVRWDKYCLGKPGLIAVYDSTPNNKYGHVAIVLADLGNSLIVFEQKGKEDPTAETKAEICERDKTFLLGYLNTRPKELW